MNPKRLRKANHILAMEDLKKHEYRHLRGALTYLVVFAIVAGTTILRFYDKISILGSIQKDLLKNGK